MTQASFSIYDASAGSGKTYNLVKEYLKIILTSKTPDAYRNILAITFTNKAVHEMKSRIVGSLSQFTTDNPSSKTLDLMQDLATDTKMSLAAIKTKSEQIIKHIIHNYAAFDISTIDKFTHKVIRAFAHDLGLSMSFEVSLDTENLLIEAVDGIIAQAGEDAVLTQLLVDFTLEKADNDKSWDISREILETGRLVLNENNRAEIASFEGKKIADFIEIKSKLSEIVKALEAKNSGLGNQILSIIDTHNINHQSFSRGTFINHILYIISDDHRAKNYTFDTIEAVKINKSAKDITQIHSILPEILNLLAIVYKNNETKDFYTAFLKNITPLSLLNTVSNELSKIQTEKNILSISEFNALIYNEIQNQPAPFIYEKLGERYRHFFIDEFQDTSEMQWKNLIPLINNATSSSEINGEKGTLMIVGDPKQSIYRWRGGKAEQFIALSKNENPFNNPDKEVIILDKNYRSYSQIIEFNNAFFSGLANEFTNEDYKDLYENHVKQETNNKKGGYVNLSFIPKIEAPETDEEPRDKDDLYVLATLNTIKKVVNQGFKYHDIVVLTRKKDQGIAVANYLTEQGIPILSSETLMIANATEVRFIIYLLKYLKNSADKDSKAHFLEYLAQNIQKTMAIHDFIAQGMALENENEFEIWLTNFDLNLNFSNIRKKNLYEITEKMSTIINTNNSSAYLQYFLDIVLERDIKYQSGISDFLDYWDKNSDKFSIPSPEGTNAVRIMTIHKSKGLEFPVVIFPYAEQDYNHKPKDKIWLNTPEETIGLPKVLIDNSKAIEGFGDEAKATYIDKKQEELLDNINVLYVALTRAEEQLYIISAMNLDKNGEPRLNQMSSFFVNYLKNNGKFESEKLEYSFGAITKQSETTTYAENNKKITNVKPILDPKNIRIAQKESIMWGTERQESIEFGNVIHEILSFINTKKDITLAIKMGLENGLITTNQKEIVEKIIVAIVNHQDLTNYFDDKNIVLNEQTIIQKEGKTIKPDRMVVDNHLVYLLDYKTGQQEIKHQLQLKNYQAGIEKMGYKVIEKTLVYIGNEIKIVTVI